MKNLLNRKLLFIAFCLILVIPVFPASWGLPTYLYILSGSIENYSSASIGELPRSHSHKGRFVNGIIGGVNSKYSSIITSNHDFTDANATTFSVINYANSYEFVFFAGHGNTGGPVMDDQTLTKDLKSFGG